MEFVPHKTGFTVTEISPEEQHGVAEKSKKILIEDVEESCLVVVRAVLALVATTTAPIKIDWNTLMGEFPTIQPHVLRRAIALVGLGLEQNFGVSFPDKSTKRDFRRSCNGNIRNNEPGSKIIFKVHKGISPEGKIDGSYTNKGRKQSNHSHRIDHSPRYGR